MSKLRVLIVDDSLTIRAILEEMLQKSDRCEVVGSASTIAEARQMIAALAPDVVTLDLDLPDLDGLSFLDEQSTHSHVPFVVVSTSTGTDTEATREALRHGAAACFDKGQLAGERLNLVRALQTAALRHLRTRLFRLEHTLKLGAAA